MEGQRHGFVFATHLGQILGFLRWETDFLKSWALNFRSRYNFFFAHRGGIYTCRLFFHSILR